MKGVITSHRKPNLLPLLILFVGVGVCATGLAQAGANPGNSRLNGAAGQNDHAWPSIWGLDLARKLKEWRPSITVTKDAEGLRLLRPFGKSGPTIQCSSALPASVVRSLRAGGDHQVGAFGTNTDLFLFLQKRW